MLVCLPLLQTPWPVGSTSAPLLFQPLCQYNHKNTLFPHIDQCNKLLFLHMDQWNRLFSHTWIKNKLLELINQLNLFSGWTKFYQVNLKSWISPSLNPMTNSWKVLRHHLLKETIKKSRAALKKHRFQWFFKGLSHPLPQLPLQRIQAQCQSLLTH